jgi:DNA endonuclease RBBP8
MSSFKYQEPSPRKKEERLRLPGQICNFCEKYYSTLNLSKQQLQERLNICSRHREKYARPKSPEHLWEIDFPSREECIRRGYINKDIEIHVPKKINKYDQ